MRQTSGFFLPLSRMRGHRVRSLLFLIYMSPESWISLLVFLGHPLVKVIFQTLRWCSTKSSPTFTYLLSWERSFLNHLSSFCYSFLFFPLLSFNISSYVHVARILNLSSGIPLQPLSRLCVDVLQSPVQHPPPPLLLLGTVVFKRIRDACRKSPQCGNARLPKNTTQCRRIKSYRPVYYRQ